MVGIYLSPPPPVLHCTAAATCLILWDRNTHKTLRQTHKHVSCDKPLLPSDINVSLLLQEVILAVHLLREISEVQRWPVASKQALCVELTGNPPPVVISHKRTLAQRDVALDASVQTNHKNLFWFILHNLT